MCHIELMPQGSAAFCHLRFATLSRSSLTRSRTPCHIRDPPICGPRKQSNKEEPELRGREIILWARHPHIDQVTGWLSDKQTGSPHAYYANMQAKLICCRGGGWSEWVGSSTHFPALPALATVSARRKTKRGVCAISLNNKIHRKMYANIWRTYLGNGHHKPRKQYTESVGGKIEKKLKKYTYRYRTAGRHHLSEYV